MSARLALAAALGLALLAGCDPGPADPATSPSPAPTTARPSARPSSPPPTFVPVTPPPNDFKPGFTCRDGSVSHAKHRQGACSRHGGVR